MKQRSAGWLAWSLCLLALAASAVVSLLVVLGFGGPRVADWGFPGDSVLVAVPFATIGLLVALRRPGNRIGWILLATALVAAIEGLSQEYAFYSLVVEPGSLPGAETMAWIGHWIWPLINLSGVFLLLLFPQGTLPSPRWRPIVWVAAAGAVVAVVGFAFLPGPLEGPYRGIQNPLGVSGARGLFDAVSIVGAMLVIGCTALAAISIVGRFRRSRGEERQQLKWIAFAAALLPIPLILSGFFPLPFAVIAIACIGCMPVAVGIAILKYRLYDIDVVINKTVVFGALAAFITVVYVAIVVGIGTAIGSGGEPNLGLSIAATAVVAVAFQPVKERVQRFANRLVYGSRATPYEVMADFSQRMVSVLSADEVLPKMAEAAASGVGASTSRVTMYGQRGEDRTAVWPEGRTGGFFDRVVSVTHKGDPIGEIAIAKPKGEPVAPAEEKLLQDLAAQAGLAMHNARLALELRQRLDEISSQAQELAASRQRIVSAQTHARRRLERDISGGPQRRLQALSERLAEAETVMQQDSDAATHLLDDLSKDANDTLDALRELARGIFPPLLADKGIVPALQAHMRKSGLNVDLDVAELMVEARFDQQVETAAYFCCLEALKDLPEQASATIRMTSSDDHLGLSITATALHPDPVRLQSMRDRIEALGGALELDSTPATGTTVAGSIPGRAREPAA